MTDLHPCPSCTAPDATPWADCSPDPWVMARCGTCDLTYLRNPVDYVALEEDFAWEKTYKEKKETSNGSTSLSPAIRSLRKKLNLTHKSKHHRMNAWFSNGKVLDIGCGNQHNVPEPMTPYDIGQSRALHAYADNGMRVRGVQGAGAEAIWDFEPDMFDGVIMHSDLEHEVDLMGVLKGLWRALKPGAPAYVRVPNFGSVNRRVVGRNWCGFRYPDHVTYFTLPTLRDVARRAGLPIDDNIKALLRKGSAPA